MAFQEVIDAKQRIIQEFVPGKQVTIAHVIANPKPDLFRKMGLEEKGRNAIGILTITPGEGTIIAADIASKSGDIEIGFIDRFSGALLITGDVSAVAGSNDLAAAGNDELRYRAHLPDGPRPYQ